MGLTAPPLLINLVVEQDDRISNNRRRIMPTKPKDLRMPPWLIAVLAVGLIFTILLLS